MALTRRDPKASFEQAPDAQASSPAAPAAAPSPAPAPEAAPAAASAAQTAAVVPVPTSTAVAPPASRSALVNAITAGKNGFAGLRDAIRVDWDTLDRLKANQGRLFDAKDKNLTFGTWVVFELVSFQENWLISPGKDSDEARQLARYSDDGKMLKDGSQTCQDYIAHLRTLDYPDAKLSERLVLVVSVLDAEKKPAGFEPGALYQMDLAPSSRRSFNRYTNQAAFDLAKKKIAAIDEAYVIRADASVETQRGTSNEFTLLNFVRGQRP